MLLHKKKLQKVNRNTYLCNTGDNNDNIDFSIIVKPGNSLRLTWSKGDNSNFFS